jgi:hypothetical protein
MCIFITVIGYGPAANAQIKIGNNPTQLNANAVLEIESVNKGLLLPRVSLVSTVSAAPMTSFSRGMVVYNTANVNDVAPGIYYCDGAKWLKMAVGGTSSASLPFWSMDGNSFTSPGVDFIGTKDFASLRFRTNNIERMSITASGWVGIGTNTPTATLQVKGQVVIDTLTAGNTATDQVLVANPADGRVKVVAISSFVSGTQKKLEVVAVNGQTVFATPSLITDINKILLYRNGVLISFTPNNAQSVITEIPCMTGDEIRIIQLL